MRVGCDLHIWLNWKWLQAQKAGPLTPPEKLPNNIRKSNQNNFKNRKQKKRCIPKLFFLACVSKGEWGFKGLEAEGDLSLLTATFEFDLSALTPTFEFDLSLLDALALLELLKSPEDLFEIFEPILS